MTDYLEAAPVDDDGIPCTRCPRDAVATVLSNITQVGVYACQDHVATVAMDNQGPDGRAVLVSWLRRIA